MEKNLLAANHLGEGETKLLTTIKQAVFRISHIVGGLRIFSRADPDVYKPVPLNKTIVEALVLIKEIYEKLGVHIVCNLEAPADLIWGDQGKLQQIIFNLLSNAKDSMEARTRGEITILTQNQDGKIVVSVKDQGSGIPDAVQQRIFEAFYTTKSVKKGTGLGLSITHSLVEAMGGEIFIQASTPAGTTFCLKFPIMQDSDSANTIIDSAPASPEVVLSGSCLAVDDEEDLLEIMVEYLTEMGFRVQSAGDGQQALDILGTQTFDLVVTDMQMPRMSGLALAQEIQKLPGPVPKIVLLTGHLLDSFTAADREIIDKLIDQVAQKPYTQEGLTETITTLFRVEPV